MQIGLRGCALPPLPVRCAREFLVTTESATHNAAPHRAWPHVAAWIAFALVAVLVRGIRWDETYEWAQILLGQVVYPESHPHHRYVHAVFSIQPHISAALVWLYPGPVFLSYVRNVASLALILMPIYLFGARLGGRAWAGHAAVAFALCGVLQPFETTYPLRIWPHPFSNGPIGTGWALLTVYALVFRHWRWAALLLCSLPAVHLGQFPPVFGAAVIALYLAWRGNALPSIRSIALPAAIGALVPLTTVVLVWINRPDSPIAGVYTSDADPLEIWRNYKEVWYHTTLHGGLHSFLLSTVTIVAALLLIGMLLRSRIPESSAPLWALLAFVGATALGVYVPMAIHYILGVDTPWLALGWVPYRMANMIPPVLLTFTVAVLVRRRHDIAIAALLLTAAAVYALDGLIDVAFWARYVGDSAWVLLVLTGTAITCTIIDGKIPKALLPAFAVAWCTLAMFHQYAAALIVAGIALGVFLQRNQHRLPSAFVRNTIPAAIALSLLVVLTVEWQSRNAAPVDGFDVPMTGSSLDPDLIAYLDSYAGPGAMIVTDNYSPFLQARLQRPVMAHWMTDSFAIYTPRFAPTIQKILGEIYGIDYGTAPDGRVPRQPEVWRPVFEQRSASEWDNLAQRYDIQYVLVPADMTLSMPRAWEGESMVLYTPHKTTPADTN